MSEIKEHKSLQHFHPVVQRWFYKNFESSTTVQNGAWEAIENHENTLIAAPTGSGKTLAAFLSGINDLLELGLNGYLNQQTYIVYVSPLKALSNDIERNLQIPIAGLFKELKESDLPLVQINTAVRSGDTTPSERTSMIKKPPHILVTTPESLYLLLTSKNGRKMLKTTTTLIIDEIHAMVQDKRGSHLSLSVERLARLVEHPLKKIGISATQKPIEKVAEFLSGYNNEGNSKPCKIIDTGHSRALDLDLELPNSPLTAVMANEVWGEIYEKLVYLIESHQTTLIFVNTRRLAERLANSLTERLGDKTITAHHGSMSKEHRHDAEQKLKNGELNALIATASMELGIDVGSIDLVCQIGSPKSIASFLQRVGRSGHTVVGTPKGRLFPLSRDELVECVALFDAIRRNELDTLVIPEKPIDILAQQIVAEVASDDYEENELFDIIVKAYPYRNLSKKEYLEVLDMLADGFTTRRGRRSAYLHYDKVNGIIRARKGARLTALTSGGSIPDHFDYDVILEPENTFVGTLNEDFAAESLPGDVFQLGNSSWRVLRVENGKIRVEDAEGQPPSIPFWLGEAPGRTIELSESVSRLREKISELLGDLDDLQPPEEREDENWKEPALNWLTNTVGINEIAADQLVMYLATAKAALKVLPSHNDLVLERFFDEVGDMHLVVHAPYGSEMNRAWGFSLRKRFCKKFNFELQAAATEESIILSLSSTHSFPLEEVYDYLKSNTVRDILIQAFLDAPVFEIRWRWNASRALAILRNRAGKKVPPQLQRMNSEDLIALVFPDQIACFENIDGEREVPDHPLVNQTIHDCLTEAMDIELLETVLKKVETRKIGLHVADLQEPSVLAQEIVNARPYAFLDETEFIERRTNAVRNRRWLDPADAKDLAQLDINAIKAVQQEAWPSVRDTEELHDALVLHSYITEEEGKQQQWDTFFEELVSTNRATLFNVNGANKKIWVSVERLPHFIEAVPKHQFTPQITVPSRILESVSTEKSLVEIVRGRLEALGPTTASEISESIGLPKTEIEQALYALENDGFVFRGKYFGDKDEIEWCERRLLARINRYTLDKLRKEIEAVSSADYMRFLFKWHKVANNSKEGPIALKKVLQQLEGFEAQAAAWEGDILPLRISNYEHNWLDAIFLSGSTIWGRFRKNINGLTNPIKTTPISLISRSDVNIWNNSTALNGEYETLHHNTQKVYDLLKQNGACFFDQIVEQTKLFPSQVEQAMSELISLGVLTSDSYTGLRAFLVANKFRNSRKKHSNALIFNLQSAGRWSLIDTGQQDNKEIPENIKIIAERLLKRYGVVFRKILERESFAPSWRELTKVYRLMELRGEIRGGRFVSGVWGEQFALPEAVPLLRQIKKQPKNDETVAISASDPLNLTGIITAGKKVSSIYSNRILYKNGIPIAVKEGKDVKFLKKFDEKAQWKYQNDLIQRNISPKLRPYLGKGIL